MATGKLNFLILLLAGILAQHVAAVDYYLQAYQASGAALFNATNSVLQNSVVISQFEWDLHNTGGKAAFDPVTVVRNFDNVSPIFFYDSASGTHLSRIIISAFSGNSFPRAVFTFSDVLVQSQTLQNQPGSWIADNTTFSYSQVTVQYTAVNTDGSKGSTTSKSWNLQTNAGA